MNHTTNYNLSQWEDADRVTRADVNADNAKIDAALTGLDAAIAGAGMLTRLYDHTLAADTARFDLNIAALNPCAYAAIFILVETPQPLEKNYCVRIDDDTGTNYGCISGTDIDAQWVSHFAYGPLPMLLMLRRSPGSNRTHCHRFFVTRAYTMRTENIYYRSKTFDQFGALNFTPQDERYPCPAGTRFLVYGLKY